MIYVERDSRDDSQTRIFIRGSVNSILTREPKIYQGAIANIPSILVAATAITMFDLVYTSDIGTILPQEALLAAAVIISSYLDTEDRTIEKEISDDR